MIRMIDSDGDEQVSFTEFLKWSLAKTAGLGGRSARASASAAPPTGQSVVAARSAKKAALDDSRATMKPSIKKLISASRPRTRTSPA